MRKLALFISIIILFISCSSESKKGKYDKLTFTNDCESSDGWNNNISPLSTENFHSGRYSNKLDIISPYSITFRHKYGDLTKKKLKSVKVSVWAYYLTTNLTNKFIVVEVVDSSKNKNFWVGIDMKEFIKSPKTWTKIEKVIQFPKQYNPETIVGVYVWNNSQDVILVDDFEIQFKEE